VVTMTMQEEAFVSLHYFEFGIIIILMTMKLAFITRVQISNDHSVHTYLLAGLPNDLPKSTEICITETEQWSLGFRWTVFDIHHRQTMNPRIMICMSVCR